MISVTIFTVVMLLVAAGLVVVFGQFRFASSNTYHANFTDASRLKAGEDVRIAGVQVGSVKSVKLKNDNTVDVKFTLNDRYQLYSSSRAVIRYQNLVGDRYMEITSGPGELRKLPAGGTVVLANTQPALDLDALPGRQGPGWQEGQRNHRRHDRGPAGAGGRALGPVVQHRFVQPDPGRP
jgi:phospholipid/cholesterol/gamma-HCH transport system substrate-binding protein